MLRAIALAACLLAVSAPASLAAEEEPALPSWLQARLVEEGMDVDTSELRLVRTVTQGGVTQRFEIPLTELPSEDPFSGVAGAPAPIPEVLVGQLTAHLMVQIGDCAGYGAQYVGPLTLVQDASWLAGVHIALGPLAGGVAASTGGDPVSNLVVIVGGDYGMDLAAGELTITEDRLEFWGACLALIGQMSGTGAWQFS